MYSNPQTQRTARGIITVCGLLFVAFSFCYLYYFQADLLALAQHVYSDGRTVYHPILSSILLTGLFTIVGVLLTHYVRLPIRALALAWTPSFLLLGCISDISFPHIFPHSDGAPWWMFAVLFVIWLVAFYFASANTDTKNTNGYSTTFEYPNFLIFALNMILVPLLGNTDTRTHLELKWEREIANGDLEQVLHWNHAARGEMPRVLYPMQAYALSVRGVIGDSLFCYPTISSSQRLLPNLADTLLPMSIDTIFRNHLGVFPSESDYSASKFLCDATRDTLAREPIMDYVLSAMLLDCDLKKYADYLPEVHTVNDSLPQHFHEAIILVAREYPELTDYKPTDSLRNCLNEYIEAIRDSSVLAPEIADSVRDVYRNSYWRYYYQHNKKRN